MVASNSVYALIGELSALETENNRLEAMEVKKRKEIESRLEEKKKKKQKKIEKEGAEKVLDLL